MGLKAGEEGMRGECWGGSVSSVREAAAPEVMFEMVGGRVDVGVLSMKEKSPPLLSCVL